MAVKKEETKKVQKKETKKVTKKAEPKTVKKTTVKKTSAPKKVKKTQEVKPVVVEEIKPTIEEKAQVKEEIKPLVEEKIEIKEDKKCESKSNCKMKMILIPIILILIGVICVLLFLGNGKSTYKLADTNQTYTGTMSVTLPSKWYASDDNQIYEKNGNYLTFKGAIYAEDLDEQYFNEMIAYYQEYYELEEVEFDSLSGYKLFSQEEDTTYAYYFLKNADTNINLILLNTDDTTTVSIINTIK